MGLFSKTAKRSIIHLTKAPLDSKNHPVWTHELENYALGVPKSVDNFEVRFELEGGAVAGYVFASAYVGSQREWQVRALALPQNDDKLVASFHCWYDGENPHLHEGGQKMYPRLPVNDRMLGMYAGIDEMKAELLKRCQIIDTAAEEAYQEAKRGSGAFMQSFREDLASGKVPSAEGLTDRMLKR